MKIAAVILGAGKGTRMNEGKASDTPKAMLMANNKPLLEYLINTFKKAEIDRVVIVIGYKKETIIDYFGDKVEYAIQDKQLGTGHAAMMAEKNLKGEVDAVIVCYGDMPLYKPETIKHLVDAYEKEKPTIAMLTVDFEDPEFWAYGRIIRNSDGYAEAIVEQKDCNSEQLKIKESNPGFYIFDSNWVWENFHKLSTANSQGEYYLTDMVAVAKEQGKKIIAVKVSEENEVFGINSPEQLKKIEEVLDSRR